MKLLMKSMKNGNTDGGPDGTEDNEDSLNIMIVLITNHNIQRIFIIFSPIWSSVRVPIFMDFINNFIAFLTIQIRIHKVTFILHFINIFSFFCVIWLSFARNFFGLSISGALNFITIVSFFCVILLSFARNFFGLSISG